MAGAVNMYCTQLVCIFTLITQYNTAAGETTVCAVMSQNEYCPLPYTWPNLTS